MFVAFGVHPITYMSDTDLQGKQQVLGRKITKIYRKVNKRWDPQLLTFSTYPKLSFNSTLFGLRYSLIASSGLLYLQLICGTIPTYP